MCKLDSTHAEQIGLSETQFEELQSVFAQFPKVKRVIVYGSRAKGNFNERSYLDLALSLESQDRYLIAAVKLALDASDLISSADVRDIAEIHNPMLLNHIQRRGVDITAP